MDIASTCGQLVIGGFAGTSLPPPLARALRDRRRGGVILFRPNVEGGPAQVASLARQVHAETAEPPLVGVDQEGGRVARLRAPFLDVPPMRTVASWEDPALAQRIARAVGTELAALGVTIDFAPVLDVNTCPDNPVIGDRAFGADPDTCASFGVSWIAGLQSAGLLACGKHFPGHGDTSLDSHVELPTVTRAREQIESVEIAPFRAAAASGVASMMTAHVIYTSLDADRPATLSRAICTDLRERIGFRGMLVSDDLEMQAIASRWSIEDAAVQAIAAGCDALLVCWTEEKQERAVDALVREAAASPAFRGRCAQACDRVLRTRGRATARPLDEAGIGRIVGGDESRAVAAEIARRLRR
jgi:beta-N-acetylhexosaminidase